MTVKPLNFVVILAGGALLGGMMATAPDFNSVFQPFPSRAVNGNIADGRLFNARFLAGRMARRINFKRFGREISRDSRGIFLIVDFEVSDVTRSTQIAAQWKGSSGRRYVASQRFEFAPDIFQERSFQPGLTDKSFAVFELPEDEVSGGQLILTARGITRFDSALYLNNTGVASPVDIVRIGP